MQISKLIQEKIELNKCRASEKMLKDIIIKRLEKYNDVLK